MQIDPRLRALNRFGLGARPGELGQIDPKGWLRAQVQPTAAINPDKSLLTTEAMIDALAAARNTGGMAQDRRQAMRKQGREMAGREVLSALRHAATTQTPFAERLARFWSNHFAISMQGEPLVSHLAGAYEREAIRPHVFGRFEDMTLASAMHPAMLIYLDQTRSIGPNSRAGRKNGRGLNENYARELLELHTLGVDGGYTQDDVRQLALMLTGWTVGGLARGRNGGEPLPFSFADRLHEPGAKILLQRRFDAAGEQEGRRAIAMLCRHPSTARFIATKLVRHFVADRPQQADVDAIAHVFQRTGGDLRAVSLALLELRLSLLWHRAQVSHATGLYHRCRPSPGGDDFDRATLRALQSMRHAFWSPPSPAGYGDTVQGWADPDSLLRRADLAKALTRRTRGRNTDIGAILAETMEVANPSALVQILDQQPDRNTQLALLLASPDFQWR